MDNIYRWINHLVMAIMGFLMEQLVLEIQMFSLINSNLLI